MQILAGKAMERRTFLRGLGAMVALPYLDAMEPAFRSLAKVGGASAAADKTRLVCMELVHGCAGSQYVGRVEAPVGAGGDRPQLRAQSRRRARPARAVARSI